jgi:hypothetical protein
MLNAIELRWIILILHCLRSPFQKSLGDMGDKIALPAYFLRASMLALLAIPEVRGVVCEPSEFTLASQDGPASKINGAGSRTKASIQDRIPAGSEASALRANS